MSNPMPGKSYTGPLTTPTLQQQALQAELRRDVTMLATTIGDRNVARPRALAAAAEHIETSIITP